MLALVFQVPDPQLHQSVLAFIDDDKVFKLFDALQENVFADMNYLFPFGGGGLVQRTFHQ